jgi:carboxypeptidase PM20D1
MANLWLFGSVVRGSLEEKPASNALLRTTMAATRIDGGTKDNVLPREARAVVNVRIAPHDSIDGVVRYVREVIANDRIDVHTKPGGSEPSAMSRLGTRGYQLLETTIRRLDPQVIVAPGLVIGWTDSRNYSEVANDTYRFAPLRLRDEDLERIHGADERISIDGYADAVGFYWLLIQAL